MHDERSRDSKDICCVVRTEFLILGEHSDTFALDEMAERSLKQRRGPQRQPDDLILARLAADPDLDLKAPAAGISCATVIQKVVARWGLRSGSGCTRAR
jgi:hypothetical protein